MPEAILAGLFGLLIGSFLNVCIHRWPRDESVVKPRSHCPGCGKQIASYDNIPVLSYFILRARCRNCHAPINRRYPLVELLTAGAFFWFALHFGPSPAAAKYCIFSALLIGMVFSDIETLILPDQFTLGGLAIGLVFSAFVPVPQGIGYPSVAEALLGALLPAGTFWLLGWIFQKVRHKEGLGFGDVKMIAMIGAFLGIAGVLLTVIGAAIAGSVIGLLYIRSTKKDAATYQLPFGAFLGAAALFAAIEGPSILTWYGELLR